MTARHLLLILLLLLAGGILANECNRNRQTGEHGQLVFEYYSDKDSGNFNKPIIAGGYVDLFVYDASWDRRVEVLEATSLTPAVARIEGDVANLFVVQGLAAGRAKFEVRARDADGEIRVDAISMRVASPDSVQFQPRGARAVSGRVLEAGERDDGTKTLTVTPGSRIRIPWTRRSAGREPLVGYGVYPIAIAPEGAARLHDRLTEDDNVTLFMPDEPATFELLPARGCRGEQLHVTVGEPDDAGRGGGPLGTVVGLWLTLSIPASLALFAVARPIERRG